MHIFCVVVFLLTLSFSYKIFLMFLYSILSKGCLQTESTDQTERCIYKQSHKNIDCTVLIYENRYLHYVEKYVIVFLLIQDEPRH